MTTQRSARKTPTLDLAYVDDGSLYLKGEYSCEMDTARFFEILDARSIKSIRVVSLSRDYIQNVWITDVGYVKESLNVEMTLRKEKRGASYHWYAYRRVHGVLHKRYVGQSDLVTTSMLLKVSRRMPSL